ncbi:MAG: hypothetical protein JO353_13075 [Phycisphaerae bacterium]|nr:hypothetical protein [Phycisphaerae bacterium]
MKPSKLTTAQFAALAGVSPSRVRQWIMLGTIDAEPLNGRENRIDSREFAKVKHRPKAGRPIKPT